MEENRTNKMFMYFLVLREYVLFAMYVLKEYKNLYDVFLRTIMTIIYFVHCWNNCKTSLDLLSSVQVIGIEVKPGNNTEIQKLVDLCKSSNSNVDDSDVSDLFENFENTALNDRVLHSICLVC